MIKLVFLFCFTLGFYNFSQAAEEAKPIAPAPPKKVLLIVLENENFQNAMKQDFLKSLAEKGGLLKNYHAVSHPSQPNYLALVGGDTFNVKNDHMVTIDQKNIADLIEQSGKSWKVYAEDYPGKCWTKERSHQYAKKHNPLISFKDIQEDPKKCANIVGFKEFNVKDLPDFAMVIPNQLNSGHDSDVKYASQWLAKFLNPLLTDSELMKQTLIIVTFSESSYAGKDNQVYTALIGANVKPNSSSAEKYDHYSLLKSIEKFLGTESLNKKDAAATEIKGIWN